MDADCVQFGVLPCPNPGKAGIGLNITVPGTMGPATMANQHLTDLEHPDGKIASFGAETISSWARSGTGVKGAGKPFFLAVGSASLASLPFLIFNV